MDVLSSFYMKPFYLIVATIYFVHILFSALFMEMEMIAKDDPKMACNIYICPPIFFNLANPGSCRGPKTIPPYRVAGYTSDRYPVWCKTNKERQITIRFHNQTCGQIRINGLPNMSVDRCWSCNANWRKILGETLMELVSPHTLQLPTLQSY